MLNMIWKWVRGIHRPEYWDKPCDQCGFAGRIHYTGIFFPCTRFVPPQGVKK